jgi:AraC-like DNA-binding protein
MFNYFPAPASLQPYVYCYLAIDGHFPTLLLSHFSARGTGMVVFPFGRPSATKFGNSHPQSSWDRPLLDRPLLLNCNDVYNEADFQGDIKFVMVHLRPTAPYHFLRQSLKGKANRLASLSDLGLLASFASVQEQLWTATTCQEAVALIEDGLISFTQKLPPKSNLDVSPVIDHIARNPIGLTVEQLAKKFNCSERWIALLFAEQTGLSPKAWQRLTRFRLAVRYKMLKPKASMLELVTEFQYTDQSHLIRDFKQFTGYSPLKFFDFAAQDLSTFEQNEMLLNAMLFDFNTAQKAIYDNEMEVAASGV